MKKNKKKLPKFWLGTRMPINPGRQINYGNGGYLYTSKPGAENVLTETNTVNSNTIPSALNKLLTNSSFAINALKDIVNPAIQGSTAALKSASTFGANSAAIGVRDVANTVNNINNIGKRGLEQTAHKAGLGTLGTVTAGIGTLYGGIDMGMQIASNKDHRTAADMRNTLTTNTYTTDLGNKYTTHGGVDIGSELDYARAQRRKRNLEFTASSIGTGMSAGALVGSLAGSSINPGLGTAIGAGVGALGGLLAYGLGFGDTEEETRAAARRLTDVTSMEDKMSYSLAMNKDAQQGFYGRTKSGSLPAAACGKQPGKKLKGYSEGKNANALVSSGEEYGELNKDGSIKWIKRAKGGIDFDDDIPVRLGEGKEPSDNSFVVTNALDPEGSGIPISEWMARTGDLYGALRKQKKYQNMLDYNKAIMMNGANTDLLMHAKNGKLPKYSAGTPIQIINASVPRIAGLIQLKEYENALKHADKSTPIEEINDYGANDAAYLMMSNLPDPRIYLNRSDRNYRNALYNIQRNPGLGHGGRAIAAANAYVQKQALDAETLSNIDEIRRQLINEALKLKYSEAQRMSNLKHDSWWRSREDRNKIMSAYNNLRAQLPANRYVEMSDLYGDINKALQFGEAIDKLDDITNIFKSGTSAKDEATMTALTNLWNNLNNGSKNTTLKAATPVEYTKVPQPLENIYKQYPWLYNNPDFMRFLQLNNKGK